MTTTRYTLDPPVLANPPGRNGRPSASPPRQDAAPRRPAPDSWDVRWFDRLDAWMPWRIAWRAAKDGIWDAKQNYRQFRSLLVAVLGPRVSRETAGARLKVCRECPHLIRRKSTYDPVSALADATALIGYGMLATAFSSAGWYVIAAGVIRAVTGVLCVPEGPSEFCARCRCGTHPLAELQSKTRLEAAECPERAWETSNAI